MFILEYFEEKYEIYNDHNYYYIEIPDYSVSVKWYQLSYKRIVVFTLNINNIITINPKFKNCIITYYKSSYLPFFGQIVENGDTFQNNELINWSETYFSKMQNIFAK